MTGHDNKVVFVVKVDFVFVSVREREGGKKGTESLLLSGGLNKVFQYHFLMDFVFAGGTS
jgi:hypothetical protein